MLKSRGLGAGPGNPRVLWDLGESTDSLGLSFLFCNLGQMTVYSSQDCSETHFRRCIQSTKGPIQKMVDSLEIAFRSCEPEPGHCVILASPGNSQVWAPAGAGTYCDSRDSPPRGLSDVSLQTRGPGWQGILYPTRLSHNVRCSTTNQGPSWSPGHR